VTVSTDLAAWAVETYGAVLPQPVVDQAVVHVKDTVGVALAGAVEPSVRAMASATADLRHSVLGQALVLGTACHALDYDNAQAPSLVHPSCVVVPVALLAARGSGRESESIVRAIAVGEEVSLWLGESAVKDGNSEIFERGLHPTGVCTPIAAAVTAGLLMGLSVEQLGHAVGAAASLSGGILEGNRTGGQVKPMHAGFAAHAGLFAARLAHAGMTAPPTAVEGRFGFVHALLGPDLIADVATLPSVQSPAWRMTRVITKPYPVNGFAHASIDAALQLREAGFRLEAGARVEIGVPEPTLRTIAEPREAKLRPPSGYAARFSGPVVAAIALRGGGGLGVGLSDFADGVVIDETLLADAARVEFFADDTMTEHFPDAIGATARGYAADGAVTEATVPHATGSPHRPLSPALLRRKFDDCVETGVHEDAEEIWSALDRICIGDSAADHLLDGLVARILDTVERAVA